MKKKTILILLFAVSICVLGIIFIPRLKLHSTLPKEDAKIVAKPGEQVQKLCTEYFYGKAADCMTGDDIYARETVVLEWETINNATKYSIALATDEEFADAVIYETKECFIELDNLLAGTNYYWTVSANNQTSEVKCFYTADTVRTVTIEGVSNTRDCGGWKTEDGKAVKQGMFYRGAQLEDITDKGKSVMLEELGIKTDLDLRNSSETSGRSSELGDAVQYINYSGPYYWGGAGIAAKEYREALLGEIRAFADADNYPIYVHCALGRDRTGSICFLIHALLGVSERDLYLDYEFSFLSSAGTMDTPVVDTMISQYRTMYDYVKRYAPDGTMAEATEVFLLRMGVTQEEIRTIRELLLE